ncbi:phosphotransferase family protein [Haliangium sp.]|uniref:phosphotransferase family protein n=1 Tax=Haliangium sp. TaxID=2663208 RepID=UPI003D13ABD3
MTIHTDAIRDLVQGLLPGARVRRIVPLGADHAEAGDCTEKGIGYGVPLRLTVEGADGSVRDLVWHTASSDRFGHDRRSDRARELLLAYDTFAAVPGHVAAVDVGAVGTDGALHSLRGCGEFYLVTEYAGGEVYAADLRRIAGAGRLEERDLVRCERLADYLVELHRQPVPKDIDRELVYTRAVRDLVGHGEGIFGIVDGYPDDAPGAPRARLDAIEDRCCRYRRWLRGGSDRLARTHSDFHPFNILFDRDDELTLLDAARGSLGDPADDVACLAVNYVFFALATPGTWADGFGVLWRRFWARYLDLTGDRELLAVAPPFLAWRALVIANPVWYPSLPGERRDQLLSLAESALDAGRLDLDSAEALFR